MGKNRARSPRRLDFDHPALAAVPLNDKQPPPKTSIAWKLWLASRDLAAEALASDYIQGIKKGTLDPNSYGQYTVQDAVYCHYAQDDYRHLVTRAVGEGEPEIAAFAKARYESYQSYNAQTFAAWHIRDVKGLEPSKAAQTYIDFEHRVATRSHPVYGLVAMIPCDELWPYLATELEPDAGPGNLYSFWITGNGDWGGAYRLDNFVDGWFADHPDVFDWEQALYVFRSCMTCEVNFFRSACGQSLLPMPTQR